MSKHSGSSFKVLIAGGSLGDFAPKFGASIGLHPQSLRILDQLGVWEDIEQLIVPLRNRKHYDATGYCFEDSQVLVEINQLLRRPIIFMERSKALEVLHSHIQNKPKLHARNAVVEYEELPDGVLVTTELGATIRGDILVGGDGIHSGVRRLMAAKIRSTSPDLADRLVNGPGFTSEYNCIFGISRNDPLNPFLPDATVHNVYYKNYPAVSATGVPGLVFWFLFVKASSTTRTPDCPRFNDTDAEALIGEYGSAQVGPGYSVRDLWETGVKAAMTPLEEGVLDQWSHGRVVLMGDATVNIGLGGNLAYEGIGRFMNALVPLLGHSPTPSLEQLTKLFNDFEASQKPRANTVVNISGQVTRYEAQDTWLYKLASRYIVPLVSDCAKARFYGDFANEGPWLQYLPLPLIDHAHPGQKLKRRSLTLSLAKYLREHLLN
ncbi:hypothetical protein BDW72DRAFT_206909 [Aspergillus terricola var. indicus]